MKKRATPKPNIIDLDALEDAAVRAAELAAMAEVDRINRERVAA